MPTPPFQRITLSLAALLAPLAFLACSGDSHTDPAPSPKPEPYFGQPLPGETPVPFAEARLAALSPWVEATALSPDGTILLVGVGTPDYSGAKLYQSRYEQGAWSPFAPAPFATDFFISHEPVFSPDGQTLTFTGRSVAIEGHTSAPSQELWTVQLANGTWASPTPMPAPISSASKEWRGSTSAKGTFYFGSDRTKPAAQLLQIYKGIRDASGAYTVEKLPAPINTNSYEGDPCIAPDESWLLFYSCRDGASADLFVSFCAADGTWGEPLKLGPEFNTPGDEYGAHLSSDGKQLFFTRHTPSGNQVLWVATSAIEKVRPIQPEAGGSTPPAVASKPYIPAWLKSKL